MTQPEFGRWLKSWRHGRRMTQRQLAAELGYDVTYVVKLEGGTRRPTAPLLARLAQLSGHAVDGFRVPTARDARPPLPAPPGPLVGRELHVRELLAELETGARCITLVGPPGIGKTRLALELAGLAEPRNAGGVWWVPLREVTGADGVAQEIHRRLGLTAAADAEPVDAVTAYLRHGRCLLVLDNFEHVLGAAPVVERILEATMELSVIVTSREPLALERERVRPVAPLALPDAATESAAAIGASPAVSLFVSRARMARADFTLTDANGTDVAEACRRLDGIPLAIVLAAGAVRSTDAAHVAAGLGLHAARTGMATLTNHERTLDDAITSSWAPLDGTERAMFTGLAVCVGGCTAPAAAAIAGIEDDLRALAVLDGLVCKSMVEARPDAPGGPRYDLLETMRAFASDRLAEAGRLDEVRSRHLDHFLAAAVELGVALVGKGQAQTLAALAADHANLAAAFEWAIIRRPDDALRLAASLWRYCLIHDIATGQRWLDRSLAACGDPSPDRALALIGAGALAWVTGAFDTSATRLTDGRALAESLNRPDLVALAHVNLGALADQLGRLDDADLAFRQALATCNAGDSRTRGTAIMGQGVVARRRGDIDAACRLWVEASRLFAEAGDEFNQAVALSNMALAAEARGLLDEAQEWRAECRRIQMAVGDIRGLAITTASLGRIAARRGRLAMARTCQLDALAGFRRVGDLRRAASSLIHLASIVSRGGSHHRALRLLGAADAIWDRLGTRADDDGPLREETLAAATRALGDVAASRALAAGRALTLDAAANLAAAEE
jgi:predicted ATPase